MPSSTLQEKDICSIGGLLPTYCITSLTVVMRCLPCFGSNINFTENRCCRRTFKSGPRQPIRIQVHMMCSVKSSVVDLD